MTPPAFLVTGQIVRRVTVRLARLALNAPPSPPTMAAIDDALEGAVGGSGLV